MQEVRKRAVGQEPIVGAEYANAAFGQSRLERFVGDGVAGFSDSPHDGHHQQIQVCSLRDRTDSIGNASRNWKVALIDRIGVIPVDFEVVG